MEVKQSLTLLTQEPMASNCWCCILFQDQAAYQDSILRYYRPPNTKIVQKSWQYSYAAFLRHPLLVKFGVR